MKRRKFLYGGAAVLGSALLGRLNIPGPAQDQALLAEIVRERASHPLYFFGMSMTDNNRGGSPKRRTTRLRPTIGNSWSG